jgi:hypothetical protein
MQVVTAILCDYASVREGLLNVLGGGVNRLWRAELPAPLNLSLALMVDLHPQEVGPPHELAITVQDDDGGRILELQGNFQAGQNPDAAIGEHALVPFGIDLRPAAAEGYGAFSVEIVIDGEHRHSIQFWVLPPNTN